MGAKPKRGRKLLLLAGIPLLLLGGIGLLPLIGSSYEPPLSILKGLKPVETREAEFYPNGTQMTHRRHIFRVQMKMDDVMTIARRELAPGHWWISPRLMYGNNLMIERPGLFDAQGMHINVRRNIVDPDSMAVLGKAEDSKKWTTITVYERIRYRNAFLSLWRRMTGNQHP